MPPESKQISNIKTSFTYFDILTLKPDSSDVVKLVPKPKEALVKNGLPKWNSSTLDTKLPLLPGPNGPFVFSRGKLGKNLWKNKVPSEFTLNDPNGYEVTFKYEPAHDKHLKRWFAVTNNQKYLLKNDLITENLDVKCSVKQYNEYRKYLHRIHSNQVCKEMKQKEENTVDEMVLKNGYKSLNKEMTKLRTKQGQINERQKNDKKIQNEEEAKRKDCLRRLKRVTETNTRLEQSKKENLKKSIDRSRAMNERVQNRIKNANEIERKRKIQFLRKQKEADIKRKKGKEEEENKRITEIDQKAKRRWEQKVENQKKQIEKEEFLRKQRKLDLELSRVIRMHQRKIEFAGLQEKIILKQCQPTIIKVKDSYKKKQKDILQVIRTTWVSEISKELSKDKKTLKFLDEKIHSVLANLHKDMDTYFLISEAKQKLTTDLEVPVPVLHTIKFLIERSIWISLAKKMEQILYSITHTILYVLDRINNSDDKTSYRKQSKIKPPPTFMFLSSETDIGNKFGKVSFGEQLKVPKNEKKFDWKSIKTRRPTPVGSVLTIANAALSDTIADKDILNIEFLEQSKVMKFIDKIAKWLLDEVEGRVRELTLETNKETPLERTKRTSFPYPWIRLCKLVLYSEKDDFISILDAIVLDVIRDIHFRESCKGAEKTKIKK